MHSKEYKCKQRSIKKGTSALLKCKSGGLWAVNYIHGVDLVFRRTQ